MVSKNTLIFFVALLLVMPESFHGKFEDIEQYLIKYEVSNSTELSRKFRIKFPTYENAERSIEIKGFGKTFILDLFIYFHHEDANIEYISKESNSTGKYQDLNALLYQGNVRENGGSFALGFFTQNKLFRGYFMTDEVYCVEPHEDKKSIILYKLNDVIFPGCSKKAKGDGLDCSQTKYFEPWKPSNPRSKVKFDFRPSYDVYLHRLSETTYEKAENKTHAEKDSDSEDTNNYPGDAQDETGGKEKNSSSTVYTNKDFIKDKKHYNNTENEQYDKNNDHHNHEKNKNDKKEIIKTIDTNQPNTTIHDGEKSSEKYRVNKDELGRWLPASNGNYTEINNKTDHRHDKNNNGGVNKTLEHDGGDNDDDDDDYNKTGLLKNLMDSFTMNSSSVKQDSINDSRHISELDDMSLVKNATKFSSESPQKFPESNEVKSAETFSGKHQIKSDVDRTHDDKEEINPINSIELSDNSITRNENFPTKLMEDVTSADFNSVFNYTVNRENNLDNSINDISFLKMKKKENESSSSSPEKKRIQKRQYWIEDFNIPYASTESVQMEPVDLECSLEILISPAFRKKFDNQDSDSIKDIFTQITLVNKLFEKVVLKRKGLPFHAIFRIGELVVYKDEAYSPFEMKGEMEDAVRYFNLQKRSCLSIGFMNKILKSPLKFVDGYLPKDNGGACARFGNFFVVSHGDKDAPVPMGLYLAALIRGFTRGFGATDENEKCQKGELPNPLQELRDNILAKQITPGKKYSVFSECNLEDIEKGLKDRKCLVELKDPLCGNAIIDDGEECDCGPGYFCHTLDPCCKPHLTAEQKMQAWLAEGSIPKACILATDAECGMSQPCCDNCLVRQGTEKLCYNGIGLCDQAYCDGKHAYCPSSANASEGLVCDEFDTTKLEPVLCKNKQCEFGLCSGFGLTPCVCASETGKECVSCCLKDGKCKAAVSELHLIDGEDLPLPNQKNCTAGLCFRGRCISEAGIQGTDASDKNPATKIKSNKVLMTLSSVFISVSTVSLLYHFFRV